VIQISASVETTKPSESPVDKSHKHTVRARSSHFCLCRSCNLACGFDLYDATQGAGECDVLIQGGISCDVDFAVDGQYAG
jgi:hypothetical protein